MLLTTCALVDPLNTPGKFCVFNVILSVILHVILNVILNFTLNFILNFILLSVNYNFFSIKSLKKRRAPVYMASPPCSSRCGECSSEGSLLRSARDLTIVTSELGSEGADMLIRKQDLDETFVWEKVKKWDKKLEITYNTLDKEALIQTAKSFVNANLFQIISCVKIKSYNR